MELRNIRYDEVIDQTLLVFPDLRSEYDREAAAFAAGGQKIGVYNLYDVVLMPRVMGLLQENGHDEELRNIFEFFELLASQPDQDVRDVVGVAVCEDLVDDEVALQRAARFMGPLTKAFCDEQLRER